MEKRVLILDDDQEILDVLSQYLSKEGYECTSTTSPRKALEELASDDVDLLITDIMMPDMNGIDVVRHAKEHDDALAIVMLTALGDVTNAIEALRSGADDYILKPFNLSEIAVSVSKALDKRALILENRSYHAQLKERVYEATADLEKTNAELRQTKDYLESLLHSTVDAIITTDTNGRIEFVNRGALSMLGFEEEELLGANLGKLYIGGVEEARYVRRVTREDKPLQNYGTELIHKNGEIVPVSISVSLVRADKGKSASMLLICKDVTDQKQLEQELKEMSIRDNLSSLYNQRHFYDRLESEIERAKRQGHPLTLLLFDIDHFKGYNDSHGHLEGDKVIEETGKLIAECTREHVDIGFRYGGDEFTVLLPEADEAQALHIAKRIQTTFEAQRFDHLTVSIGLMTYKEGYSLRSFIQFTDSMMYDAKRAGGNRVYIYDPRQLTKEAEGKN